MSIQNEISAGASLHISHLTRNVEVEHLKEIFGHYGQIRDAVIRKNTENIPNGTAVVTFEEDQGAEQALYYLDGGQIDGVQIKVSFILVQPKDRDHSRSRSIHRKRSNDFKSNERGALRRDFDQARSGDIERRGAFERNGRSRDRNLVGRLNEKYSDDHSQNHYLPNDRFKRDSRARSRYPNNRDSRERTGDRGGWTRQFNQRRGPGRSPPRRFDDRWRRNRFNESPARRRPSPVRNGRNRSGSYNRRRKRSISRSRSYSRNRRRSYSRSSSRSFRRRRSRSFSSGSSRSVSRSYSRSSSYSRSKSRRSSSGSESRKSEQSARRSRSDSKHA